MMLRSAVVNLRIVPAHDLFGILGGEIAGAEAPVMLQKTLAPTAEDRPDEIIVRVKDVCDLFREGEFDPFTDELDTVPSIAAMAQLPQLVSRLKAIRLRVLVPAETLSPHTERCVQDAMRRYCAYMATNARRKLAAMRWVGARTFLIGVIAFGISLAASSAVQRLLFIPEGLRTLASESLIIAGWVIVWQPFDTLVQGWWPQWKEERTFRAIAEIPLTVGAIEKPPPA